MNPFFRASVSPADKRSEVRRPGKGKVVVHWAHPRRQEIQGTLVDVSDSGFRMAHNCSALTAGQYVGFSHFEAKGRARVVWTRIVLGSVESGFVVAAD